MCLEALENIMLVCGATHKYEGSGMNGTNDNTTKEPTEDHLSRRLLPRDILMLEQKRMGAIVLHIFGIIYTFCAIALVCDEYFVPLLEIIIKKVQISRCYRGNHYGRLKYMFCLARQYARNKMYHH